MLKQMGLRKLLITTMALVVLGLIYLFPVSDNKSFTINEPVNYIENLSSVYLVDKNDYVAQVKVDIDEKSQKEKIKEKLEYLIVDGKRLDDVPNGFRPIIPSGTIINNIEVDDNIVAVDFSKEILSISEALEEAMIEAIVFTITTEDDIEGIVLTVDGERLLQLPNSKKILPNILDRSYGINKLYDIDSIYGLTETTIYFINNNNGDVYYVPVTKVSNDDREKISIIIDELKSSLIYQTNLNSYLNYSAELEKYEVVNNIMYLTFNDRVFDNLYNENIMEEVKYTISMSVKDNYEVDEVVFLYNDKEITKSTLKELE